LRDKYSLICADVSSIHVPMPGQAFNGTMVTP
jgi:hypothetical protein